MPEVSDPTHLSEHDRVITMRSVVIFAKRDMLTGRKKPVRMSCLVRWEGAAEGGADNWGEVVTR